LEKLDHYHIGIIGLGYVGLPLSIEFAKKYKVSGFDLNASRVAELNRFEDSTHEANLDDLRMVCSFDGQEIGLSLSADLDSVNHCNVYIVTVPTPISQFKTPDLSQLLAASEMIGSLLKKGDVVIYESTVYPGCTEENCVPVLEDTSGMVFNKDFFVGYSPERINPGDKVHTLVNIKKVTSGSTPEIATVVDHLYATIITAGTHKAPSIKVAEASKAIENAQRDINISFVNELALIFDQMGIDTSDVLEAAGTKWNFLNYRPGLVGGHCISVDPYYLTHKAESLGYHPQVILSGRRVNDNMGRFIANKVIKLMIRKGTKMADAEALILGITFKENCPDARNTKVIDIYTELMQFGIKADVYDPWASPREVENTYGVKLTPTLGKRYDAIILAVAHQEFASVDYLALKKNESTVIFDIKSFLPRDLVDCRL
jgi:UDP-N-acetyl-D-galactosamine dehydrogenase